MPDLEDDDEWEIEEVKDKATIKGTTHYLVKWEGWPTEYNQWIPEEDMGNAQDAIRRHEKDKRKNASKNTIPVSISSILQEKKPMGLDYRMR
jgi:hypothetical protein